MDGAAEVARPERHEPIEILALDGAHGPLRDRIHVEGLERGCEGCDAGVAKDAPKLLGELGVVAEDEEALRVQKAVLLAGEVAGDLSHERAVGARRDVRDQSRRGRAG